MTLFLLPEIIYPESLHLSTLIPKCKEGSEKNGSGWNPPKSGGPFGVIQKEPELRAFYELSELIESKSQLPLISSQSRPTPCGLARRFL